AEPKAPAAEPKAPADKKEMAVTGRVLDADGKPLAGAEVAVMAWPKAPHRGGDLSSGKPEVLGRDKTDAEGRFRLTVPRPSSGGVRAVVILASGDGHGVGWQHLKPDADMPAAEIRLAREQVLRGRFIDVQGQPAGGVTVRVGSVRAPGSEGISAAAAGR